MAYGEQLLRSRTHDPDLAIQRRFAKSPAGCLYLSTKAKAGQRAGAGQPESPHGRSRSCAAPVAGRRRGAEPVAKQSTVSPRLGQEWLSSRSPAAAMLVVAPMGSPIECGKVFSNVDGSAKPTVVSTGQLQNHFSHRGRTEYVKTCTTAYDEPVTFIARSPVPHGAGHTNLLLTVGFRPVSSPHHDNGFIAARHRTGTIIFVRSRSKPVINIRFSSTPYRNLRPAQYHDAAFRSTPPYRDFVNDSICAAAIYQRQSSAANYQAASSLDQ